MGKEKNNGGCDWITKTGFPTDTFGNDKNKGGQGMRERQYGNKVLEKGIQVINALGYPEYAEMSIEDLSKSLGIPKGTLFTYLGEFERNQWLEQTQDKKWRIAPSLTRLAEGFRKKMASNKAEIERMEKDHLGGEE